MTIENTPYGVSGLERRSPVLGFFVMYFRCGAVIRDVGVVVVVVVLAWLLLLLLLLLSWHGR